MKSRLLGRCLALLIVALFVMAATGWVVRLVGESKLANAQERFEADTGSLSLADYVLPVLDEDENAAVWLRTAAESLQMPHEATEVMSEVLESEAGDWSSATRKEAAALIDANVEVFGELERTLGLEASSFEFTYEEGFNAVTPPMLELYRLGRLVAVDLRLALVETDIERVSRDLEILDQLSRALARESFLVSALMHLAVERLFLGALRDVVGIGIGDSETLGVLQTRLADRESAEVLRRSIAGEAAAVLDAARLRGTSADSTGRAEQLGLWLSEPFQLAPLLDSYSEVVRALTVPWIETLEKGSVEQRVGGWPAHQFMLTNLLDAVDKLKAVELGQRLAAEALSLSQERSVDGRLPEAVVEGISDPYASGTIAYQIRADGDASLEAPEAIALWMTQHGSQGGRQQPVFSFRLSRVVDL